MKREGLQHGTRRASYPYMLIRSALITLLAMTVTCGHAQSPRSRSGASARTSATPDIGKSLVYVYRGGTTTFGSNYSGTGFFVTRSGAILTAAHVVPRDWCTIQCDATTSSLVFDADVKYRDAERDIALLTPVSPVRTRVTPLAVSQTQFRERRRYNLPILFALDSGWPEFRPSVYEAWAISANKGYLYFDLKTPGGASGSPVLDEQQRVGAVLVSTRALPMKLGAPDMDPSTTAGLVLPDSQEWFFVAKAVTITASDVEKMLRSGSR